MKRVSDFWATLVCTLGPSCILTGVFAFIIGLCIWLVLSLPGCLSPADEAAIRKSERTAERRAAAAHLALDAGEIDAATFEEKIREAVEAHAKRLDAIEAQAAERTGSTLGELFDPRRLVPELAAAGAALWTVNRRRSASRKKELGDLERRLLERDGRDRQDLEHKTRELEYRLEAVRAEKHP